MTITLNLCYKYIKIVQKIFISYLDIRYNEVGQAITVTIRLTNQ